jgi:outer membrane receptor for ferrienterochelin and colicins
MSRSLLRRENALDNIERSAILAPPSMNQPRSTRPKRSGVRWLHPKLVGRFAGLLILFVALALRAADRSAQTKEADLTNLSLEALMEIEVPKVYGASKFEQRTTEAPSSISLVSSDEIKKYGHRTLGDVLQSLQGFHVSYDRNYAFLGTRGVNLGDFNSRALLLINGHRVNNNLTDGAFIDSAFILDVDLIDRVEVIRGPGSVLYGNNAFFGVINVVTRTGKQLNGAELSGEFAEFDTYKGRVTYGKSFTNGLQFLVSGSLYDSDGPDKLFYKEFSGQNRGIARGLDDDFFGSFFGSINYHDFTLEGGFISREKGNPTAQHGTTFNDPRLRTTDERSYAALKYAHSFPDIVDVTAQVYYDRSVFDIFYPAVFGSGTNTLDFSSAERDVGEWWGAELQFNKRLYDRHVVTLGAEYRDDFRQEQNLSRGGTTLEDRQSHGVYGQGDVELHDKLRLNGGLRYDQYGDYDPAFNPRVALIAQPFERSTIKAIYGTAFRVPNFLELALAQNPDELEPEEITSYELVYEQGITRHLRTSASAFYNRMDGLIAFENGGFTNFDAATRGMELAVEGSWSNGVRTRLSYTLQNTERLSRGVDLPDSPEHLIKLNVSVPLWKDKVFAGLEYQYTSQRGSLHNTTAGGQPATVRGESTGGYGVVNLTLYSRELIENLEFSASVYNLFDRTYADPATRFHVQDTLERDGRSFRLKMTYRF